MLDSGTSATVAAKAYRRLRAILMTAVDDGVLARNSCRIRGGGSESTPERPVLTVAQAFGLATLIPEPYGLMVLVTTFGSLRGSEATALRRRDVVVEADVVRISSAFVRRSSGEITCGAPKSRPGDRVVVLPKSIMDRFAEYFTTHGEAPDALVFTGDHGARFTGATSASGFGEPRRFPRWERQACTSMISATRGWPDRLVARGADQGLRRTCGRCVGGRPR